MLKTIFIFSALAFTVTAHSAAPVVYQAKAIVALMSDGKVVGALPGGYITQIKYRADIGPLNYEILSRDYATTKSCTTSVKMKISNSEIDDPEYGVEFVGTTKCY